MRTWFVRLHRGLGLWKWYRRPRSRCRNSSTNPWKSTCNFHCFSKSYFPHLTVMILVLPLRESYVNSVSALRTWSLERRWILFPFCHTAWRGPPAWSDSCSFSQPSSFIYLHIWTSLSKNQLKTGAQRVILISKQSPIGLEISHYMLGL